MTLICHVFIWSMMKQVNQCFKLVVCGGDLDFLTPPKTDMSPEKYITFLLKWHLFRGHVSFQGCNFPT